MSTRIFIADDHALLVDGLRLIIDSQPDLNVVGIAKDGLQAVSAIHTERPDVVLMDISLPGLNGLAALGKLHASHPEIRVIVLTMHATREHVYSAMRAGAWGYVLKESAGRELLEAVRRVAAGHRFLGRGAVDLVAADRTRGAAPPPEASPFEALSVRELQVLQLLADGKVPKEIAAILGISPKTVDTYRRRLMTKLEVDSLAALVKLALRFGITAPWS